MDPLSPAERMLLGCSGDLQALISLENFLNKQLGNTKAYHRMGLAIPAERKATMDERLALLGMKTMGDLTTFFITGDGVVQALQPLVPAYREKNKPGATMAERRAVKDAIKGLSSEEVAQILSLATKAKAGE